MAARKLQSEIDRTLKKVAEGVELFEGVYEKMQISTNQTQKEKLEGELKQHIKKLQRMRDQIKTWLASNEIKDKSMLVDNRKLIETQMERFKACEKEMKTKAFSKEGLSAAQKMDPREKEKVETAAWLSGMVEDLQRQIEQTEAEVEAMQGGPKKKGKNGGDDRLRILEELNGRRIWHMGRMEIVLRLLENGTLPPDKVLGLKDDISFFVQSNTDEDFEEDEGIYEELNLHEEEEKLGLAQDELQSTQDSQSLADDLPPRTPARETPRKTMQEEESSTSSNNKKEETQASPTTKKQLPLRRMTLEKSEAPKPPPAPNFVAQPMSSALKAGLPSAPGPKPVVPPMPTLRYSTAAMAAVSPPPQAGAVTGASATSSAASIPQTKPLMELSDSEPPPIAPPSPSLTQVSMSISAPSPVPSSAIAPSQLSRVTPPLGGTLSYLASPVSVQAPPLPGSPAQNVREVNPSAGVIGEHYVSPTTSQSASGLPHMNGAQEPQDAHPNGDAARPSPHPSTVSDLPAAQPEQTNAASYSDPSNSGSSSPRPPSTQPPYGVKTEESSLSRQGNISRPTSAAAPQTLVQPTRTASAASSRYPASLSDLVSSFEAAKQKSVHRMANPEQVNRVLANGYETMPRPKDAEKPTYYKPRHPCRTPEYYPQQPLSSLNDPRIFEHAEVEMLFFAFYYQPGTYQQYLAARELKKQSWRFHKQYLTWFQRHQEPQAITEEYEQGSYIYFDWENSWCQRKKSDFRFEYRYLSED